MKLTTLLGATLAAAILVPAMAGAVDAPSQFAPCKSCHKTEAGAKLVGPTLFGVYGRNAGTLEGFNYSDPFKKATAGWTWNDENLTKWLTDPKAVAPGTKMAFAGVKKPEDIKVLIEFLKTLK